MERGHVVPGEQSGQWPFEAHVELLQSFLAGRVQIVERIQSLLGSQQQAAKDAQDRSGLTRQFEDCFYMQSALTRTQAQLRGQLQQAHWDSGFRPRDMPEVHNDLVHPAEMMRRAFNLWQQTRWPGRNGRIRYAQTLFNLYLLRCLELLVMRLWDAGPEDASDRLRRVQTVLDQLWKASPADQPVLVRDARWLVPVAQSPTTDELSGYFEVAEKVATGLRAEDRLEVQKASVLMAGGHLRSQLRHFTMQGTALDDRSLLLSSRGSNALDFAMTVQCLVPLLKAYEAAWQHEDGRMRDELADAICQGVSPDPDLFVNRLDLLAAYSMIEGLFTSVDEAGRVSHTPMGLRHVQMLREYRELVIRLAARLHRDCRQFNPGPGSYSPYGILYGFSTNLTEHMALKTLQPDPVTSFSLEDAFTAGDAAKLAWVNGWRKLPHVSQAVQKLYDYPGQFAQEMFERVERAWHRRAAGADADVCTGRLFLPAALGGQADAVALRAQELACQYVLSSDTRMVAAGKALACDEARLLHDRREGMYVVSFRTPGGWNAISKDILTDLLGTGRDAKITDLPAEAADILCLTCPGLAVAV